MTEWLQVNGDKRQSEEKELLYVWAILQLQNKNPEPRQETGKKIVKKPQTKIADRIIREKKQSRYRATRNQKIKWL